MSSASATPCPDRTGAPADIRRSASAWRPPTIRKHFAWLLPLAGISALLLVLLTRAGDAPADSGTVIVAPASQAPPSAAPTPVPYPAATETPKAKTILIPEAPATTADGEVVTRCTDPEC